MNIVLTGFMASGKSVISKEIARISGKVLIDTDNLIVKNEGMSINDIFAKHGEAYFRHAESDAVKLAAKTENAVISTGGGTVLNRDNIDILRKNGVIVNLAPDFEVIETRLEKAAASRPLLQKRDIAEIRRLFEERKPFYENCDLHIHITDGKTPEEYAREILEKVK